MVEDYLQTKIDLGRLADPYNQSELPEVHTSKFGVIPKWHQPCKWQLIVDLSYPKGHSFNDGIPRSLYELQYITINDAIQKIVQLGQRLYIDTCLPFGLKSAPKLFNILADLLSWIILQQKASFLLHYLDDFLTIRPPISDICRTNLNIIMRTCEELGCL